MFESNYLPYYYEGSIYNYHGSIIEDLAILIDSTDVFLLYGSYDKVNDKFKSLYTTYACYGMEDEINNIKLIRFNNYTNELGNRRLCYILRRCIGYTGTGFVRKLWHMVDTSKENFLIWIDKEMERIPINIERKD